MPVVAPQQTAFPVQMQAAASNAQNSASNTQRIETPARDQCLANRQDPGANDSLLKQLKVCLLGRIEVLGNSVNQLLSQGRSIGSDVAALSLIREDLLDDGKIMNSSVSAAQACFTDTHPQARLTSLIPIVLSAREYLEAARQSLSTASQFTTAGRFGDLDTRMGLLLNIVFPGSTQPLTLTRSIMGMENWQLPELSECVDLWHTEVQALKQELEQAMDQAITATATQLR